MGKHLTPTEVCERLIGPPQILGPLCGKGEKAAYLWRRASTGRDPGDIPSAPNMRALLAHSEAHALGLTAEHLILGATEAEVAAILAARATPAPAFTTRRRAAGPDQVAAE